MRGRADQVLDLSDTAVPNASFASPSAPIGQLQATALAEAMTARVRGQR
jgi:hypothetical protein